MVLLKNKKENGEMKVLFLFLALTVDLAFAVQWDDYDAFEADATNAILNVGILMSDGYTNRLHLCRGELVATNEMASAALLMLAMSDDAKSNCVREFIGNTNALCRIAWFLDCPASPRILWQKICAITMLSTANRDASIAREHFAVATKTLQQWDAFGNCFSGGELYKAIARYFGASELTPRQSLIFAAAISAEKAGLKQQFESYTSLLPVETRSFLEKERW